MRDTLPLPTRPRNDGRSTSGSPWRGSRETVLVTAVQAQAAHEENEADRLTAEEAAVEAAANVTAPAVEFDSTLTRTGTLS